MIHQYISLSVESSKKNYGNWEWRGSLFPKSGDWVGLRNQSFSIMTEHETLQVSNKYYRQTQSHYIHKIILYQIQRTTALLNTDKRFVVITDKKMGQNPPSRFFSKNSSIIGCFSYNYYIRTPFSIIDTMCFDVMR